MNVVDETHCALMKRHKEIIGSSLHLVEQPVESKMIYSINNLGITDGLVQTMAR